MSRSRSTGIQPEDTPCEDIRGYRNSPGGYPPCEEIRGMQEFGWKVSPCEDIRWYRNLTEKYAGE